MYLLQAVDGYLLHRSTALSPETLRTERVWLHQLADHVDDIEVADVTADQIRDWLLHQRERGLSPFTVKRCHASVSALYTWLTDPDIGLADRDVTDAVDPPRTPTRKPKALSQDDIESLLDAAQHMILRRRARAIVLFLVDSGARASELCGVTMDDIDLKTGKCLVTGKRDKSRYTFLGSRARSACWLYVSDERPEPSRVGDDKLFLTIDGYPMDRYSLRHAVVRLADRAEIHATPHMFRHTAAVCHLKNGMDLVSLQHLMGHSDIQTTRGYLDAIADEDVGQTAQRTSPADNWRL